jgi:hypothetical protein
LDWIRKDDGHPDHPMRNPAAAAKLLAEMRGADPLTALNDLIAWLDEIKAIRGLDERTRSEILSLIQAASDPHLSALLAPFFAKPSDKQTERESTWHLISKYLTALSGALCASAGLLLKEAATNPSLQLPAAAGAARGLHACRSLLKVCLVRYLSAPPNLWRMAYAVHREAETAECAGMPVRMHAAQKTTTTVTQELLRLLMLQSCSPEMMAPGQIEVADWVVEQLGMDFTLRPRGVADNPFCFDPASEAPPRRATGPPPDPDAGIRYFGPGMGYDTLGRIYKQMGTTSSVEIKTSGKEIAPHLQLSAVQHLLTFLGAVSPYTPPARSPATGTVRIIHGYAQTWLHLSRVRTTTSELTLAEDGDAAAAAPEAWTLQDTGGNELGVEIPQRSGDWARCGDVVGVSTGDSDECWLGLIRSMHAEPGHGVHANIYIMSRNPQAMQLRAVVAKGEDGISEESARQFSFNRVRAIIISDGSDASHPPNMLLPPDSWKEGCVFEATVEGAARYLRGARLLRRGDDYVRATFEWAAQA